MKQAEEKGTCKQGALLTHFDSTLLDADVPPQHLSVGPPVKAQHLCFRSPGRATFRTPLARGESPSWLHCTEPYRCISSQELPKHRSCKISTTLLLIFLHFLFAGTSADASKCYLSALVGDKTVPMACKAPPFCCGVRQTPVARLLLLSLSFPDPSLTATQGGALVITVRLADVIPN